MVVQLTEENGHLCDTVEEQAAELYWSMTNSLAHRKRFCGCWKKAAIKTLGTNPAGELYYNPGQTNSLKGSVLISFDCEIVNCIERYFNVLGYF